MNSSDPQLHKDAAVVHSTLIETMAEASESEKFIEAKEKVKVGSDKGKTKKGVALDSAVPDLKPVYSPPLMTKGKNKADDVTPSSLPQVDTKLTLDDVVESSDLLGLDPDALTTKILERTACLCSSVCF